MGASSATTAWNQGLEHGAKRAPSAAAEAEAARKKNGKDGSKGSNRENDEEDSGGDDDAGGGQRTDGSNNSNRPPGEAAAAAVSPKAANISSGNSTEAVAQDGERFKKAGAGTIMTDSGGEATTPGSTTGAGEGDQVGGENPSAGATATSPGTERASAAAAVTPSGTAPDSKAMSEPEYEDLGDVALAAVLLAKTPGGMVVKQPAPPASVPAVEKADIPPPSEETLEYYEAKTRYLAAQEKAHGRSACTIQASEELWLLFVPCCLRRCCCRFETP